VASARAQAAASRVLCDTCRQSSVSENFKNGFKLNSSKKRIFPCLLEGAVMSPPTAGIQGADSAVSLEKNNSNFRMNSQHFETDF
jgi:hypothetical protein